MTRRDVLTGELRQALENWFGETLGGPWDDIIDTLAHVVDDGSVTVGQAARLDQLLRATTDAPHETCETCKCPMPGMTHHG